MRQNIRRMKKLNIIKKYNSYMEKRFLLKKKPVNLLVSNVDLKENYSDTAVIDYVFLKTDNQLT
jgi:hypothetical protein